MNKQVQHFEDGEVINNFEPHVMRCMISIMIEEDLTRTSQMCTLEVLLLTQIIVSNKSNVKSPFTYKIHVNKQCTESSIFVVERTAPENHRRGKRRKDRNHPTGR